MSVKLFFWNVRGLNDPDKYRPFNYWLHIHRPLFGAILETHIKETSLSSLMSKVCNGWNYSSNHAADEDGRIILIWKAPLTVQIVHQSRQSMTCILTLPAQQPIYYTAVYASNLSAERVDLWVELLHLHGSLDLDNNNWMIGGDFNQIMYPAEHSSSAVVVPDNQMYQFQDCMLQTGLFDLRYNGPSHSWTNKQPSDPIGKK